MATWIKGNLETLLKMAFYEPAYLPGFYEILLASKVYIVIVPEIADAGVIKTHETLKIMAFPTSDDRPVIPFFSSAQELKRSVDYGAYYVCVGARYLFSATLGGDLVLNPKSKFAKRFSATEINSLIETGAHYPAVQTKRAHHN